MRRSSAFPGVRSIWMSISCICPPNAQKPGPKGTSPYHRQPLPCSTACQGSIEAMWCSALLERSALTMSDGQSPVSTRPSRRLVSSLCQRGGCSRPSPHGRHRPAAAWRPLEVIETVLGHVSSSRVGNDQRYRFEAEAKVALVAWGEHVMTAIEPSKKASVVPFPRNR